MRTELKENQNLLCDVAAAMDQMDLMQKQCQDDALATSEQLHQKIQYLKVRILY